jgi:CubicO group peptidase (beta-lactamase class C family)
MLIRFSRCLAACLLALASLTTAALGQNGPPPHVRATIQAIERMLESGDDAALRTFAAERFTPAYRNSFSGNEILAHLKRLREAPGGPIGSVTLERDEEGLRMNVQGEREVVFRVVLDDKGMITKLDLIPSGAASEAPADSPWSGVTWETLGDALRRAESGGFSGTMLARRDGHEVLRAAVGLADRESKRGTALNTVYCIGSTPIDFTVTGIMLLGQRGKLALDDPIGHHFAGVPADKRAMTIRHLLSGRSGLPDFFHVDSVDWDADLAWIDRKTAVRRILSQRLRFAPGTERAHSHAAFVLLAALIEQVSGRTYQEFVRQEILTPLGMTRTGFYGERLGLTEGDFAVGYGSSAVGIPNISPNWGPTSWLIMGSGGMCSTLEDMDRYYAAIDEGRLLTGEWAKWQQGPRAGAGGSDRGFFIYRVTNGAGSSILYLMNGEGRARENRDMTRAMDRLVEGR